MTTQDKPQTKNTTHNTTPTPLRQNNDPKSASRTEQDNRSGSVKNEPQQSDRKVSNY